MNNEWNQQAAMPNYEGNLSTAVPEQQRNSQEEMQEPVQGYGVGFNGYPGFGSDIGGPVPVRYGFGPFLGGLAGGLLTSYLLFPHYGGYGGFGGYGYYPYYPGFFW